MQWEKSKQDQVQVPAHKTGKWFSYGTRIKCSEFTFQIQKDSDSPPHLEHLKQNNANKQNLSQLGHIFISG